MAKCLDFVLKLMRYLHTDTTNIHLSPLALESTMLAILSGAKSTSFSQLIDTIFDHISVNTKFLNDHFEIVKQILEELSLYNEMKLNNFIYLSSEINIDPKFNEMVTNMFGLHVKQVDFNANTFDVYNIIDGQVR